MSIIVSRFWLRGVAASKEVLGRARGTEWPRFNPNLSSTARWRIDRSLRAAVLGCGRQELRRNIAGERMAHILARQLQSGAWPRNRANGRPLSSILVHVERDYGRNWRRERNWARTLSTWTTRRWRKVAMTIAGREEPGSNPDHHFTGFPRLGSARRNLCGGRPWPGAPCDSRKLVATVPLIAKFTSCGIF